MATLREIERKIEQERALDDLADKMFAKKEAARRLRAEKAARKAGKSAPRTETAIPRTAESARPKVASAVATAAVAETARQKVASAVATAAVAETARQKVASAVATAAVAETARQKVASAVATAAVAETARQKVASAVATAAVTLSTEVYENFKAWFVRNVVSSRVVRMGRLFGAPGGRIGHVSYARAGELDDICAEGGTSGKRRSAEERAFARQVWYQDAMDRAYSDHADPLTTGELLYIASNPLIAMQLALGITDLRGLRCLRRGLTERINRLQNLAGRSRYYAKDNARRRALAAERRKITRRTTLNPCPTPEAIRAAFSARKESVEAKIRLGGLLQDLECYVDNCLRIDAQGDIVGRNGGVKEWLHRHVPELAARYTTVMRYKALAKRLRQAAQIADPIPTSAVYDGLPSRSPYPEDAAPTPAAGAEDSPPQDYYAVKSHAADAPMVADEFVRKAKTAWSTFSLTSTDRRRQFAAVLTQARGIVAACPNTWAGLFRSVDALLEETEQKSG